MTFGSGTMVSGETASSFKKLLSALNSMATDSSTSISLWSSTLRAIFLFFFGWLDVVGETFRESESEREESTVVKLFMEEKVTSDARENGDIRRYVTS